MTSSLYRCCQMKISALQDQGLRVFCVFFLGFKILSYIFVLQSLPKTRSLEGAPEKKKVIEVDIRTI